MRCCRDELLEQIDAQRAAKRRTLEERGEYDVFATAHTDTLGSVLQKPDGHPHEVSIIAYGLPCIAAQELVARPCRATTRFRRACKHISASVTNQGRGPLPCPRGGVARLKPLDGRVARLE